MEYESNGKTTNCSTENESISISSKKTRTSTSFQDSEDFRFFDGLPADLVIAIASRLGASADCPAHLLNFRLTCKRMNALGLNPVVLSVLSPKAFACSAKNWCNQAHKFLIFCKNAGNLEATYTLGMIWFYYSEGYEKMRRAGLSLITIAAEKYHPAALYSLAVIKFNGSDTGGRSPKDHTQSSSPLMSDYGYAVPEDNPHPGNQFLAEWFKIRGGPKGAGLRLCSNELCGVPETRMSFMIAPFVGWLLTVLGPVRPIIGK